jgi:hypothetical protein
MIVVMVPIIVAYANADRPDADADLGIRGGGAQQGQRQN